MQDKPSTTASRYLLVSLRYCRFIAFILRPYQRARCGRLNLPAVIIQNRSNDDEKERLHENHGIKMRQKESVVLCFGVGIYL